MPTKLFLLLVLAVAACSDGSTTSLELDVKYDSAWALDKLEVSMNDKRSSIDVRGDVRLLLPEDWAGQLLTVTVDGVREGSVVAHGEAELTIHGGEVAHATVEMMVLTGPACEAETDCTIVPDPTCISATTLREAVGPGTCEMGACKYEYVDTICDNGCSGGSCICDSVTEQSADTFALTTVIVDRTFKVNSTSVPDSSVNGYGALYLRNTLTGDEVFWGYTYQGSVPVPILSGLYDVYFENLAFGSGAGMAVQVPRNKRARIATGVDLTSATTLDLDVTAVKADRSFTVNASSVGNAMTNGQGMLFLRNTATGDEVVWGPTYNASYPVQVISGNYEVFYEQSVAGTGAGGATVVPLNSRARISTSVAVTSDTPITLNVNTVAADRTFTVNGASVLDQTANGYGSLYLRNTATGDEVFWGSTYTSSYPRTIITGTYDVYYQVASAGSGAGGVVTVPRNTRARISQGVNITTTDPIPLAVTAVTVDRTFKVNGIAMASYEVNGSGTLFIRNTATNDEINWGATYTASYPRQIISGSYDIYYEVAGFGSGAGGATTVPRNKRARVLANASLTTPTPVAIDVTAVTVDRVFKVNNAVLTDTTINGYGYLFIRTDAGDEIAWGATTSSTSPSQIIAGTYDVYYENTVAGTGAGMAPMVPRNKKARVAPAASLTTSTPLVLDMTVVKIDRTVEVNGVAVPDSMVNGSASLYLRSGNDELGWGATFQSSMRVAVLAGKYDRAYELYSKGSGAGGATTVPHNKKARLSCISVSP